VVELLALAFAQEVRLEKGIEAFYIPVPVIYFINHIKSFLKNK
jgi:hypothetical protein